MVNKNSMCYRTSSEINSDPFNILKKNLKSEVFSDSDSSYDSPINLIDE